MRNAKEWHGKRKLDHREGIIVLSCSVYAAQGESARILHFPHSVYAPQGGRLNRARTAGASASRTAHEMPNVPPLLLYTCPMFVTASHKRGTSHCLSCTMRRQWSGEAPQEHKARPVVSQPAFLLYNVRFVQVEFR